jgi:hypothetical protein
MKGFATSIVALVITLLVSPAAAYVVVVSTSVDVSNAADETQLQAALESAIQDVLAHAIAFTPTVVTLEGARRIGNEVYLFLFIADADGEKSMKAFSTIEPSHDPRDLSAEESRRSTF